MDIVLSKLVDSLPVIVVIIIWMVYIEIRLAKISTHLFWIKKELTRCLQILAENTP